MSTAKLEVLNPRNSQLIIDHQPQMVRDALAAAGRRKVIVAGLWTEVCNTTFALSAMLEGDYEIYMVADASGDVQCFKTATGRGRSSGPHGSGDGTAPLLPPVSLDNLFHQE